MLSFFSLDWFQSGETVLEVDQNSPDFKSCEIFNSMALDQQFV
jgi:hypothetical protein